MKETPTRCQRALLADLEPGVAYATDPGLPCVCGFPAWTDRINLEPTLDAMVRKGLLRIERVRVPLDKHFGQMHVTGFEYPVYFRLLTSALCPLPSAK